MCHTGLFLINFWSSNKYQTNFYKNLMWKNVHPVYGAGIQTQDLENMNLLQ